jgi:DNA polymerase-3 subunit epsilon
MLKKAEKYNKIIKLIELDKPLIIFDLETTGLALSMDRIIQIAYIKILLNGRMIKESIFLNPEIEVTEEAAAIHGITNRQLKDEPTFKEKAKELWDLFYGCYYSGYNVIGFDLPMLKREFLRVGMDFIYSLDDIIDSKQIYYYMAPRTLSAAYKYYCQKELVDAHDALADVEAVTEILVKQLEKYKEARDWNFIRSINKVDEKRWVDNDRKFYWRNGEAYFAFSKYKDISLAKVAATDPEFLRWILSANFSDETKTIVNQALQGNFPEKRKEDAS